MWHICSFTHSGCRRIVNAAPLVTERARKLRSQYALHINDLRARIERRVNRVPVALRKATLGELLEKIGSNASSSSIQPVTSKKPLRATSPTKQTIAPATSRVAAQTPRKVKDNRYSIFFLLFLFKLDFHFCFVFGRMTALFTCAKARLIFPSRGNHSDKENAPAAGTAPDEINNPKRRGKAGAAAGASRVVSQEIRGADYRILSPKSLNSRTYPQSPFVTSPEKVPSQPSYISRPISPLKASSPLKAGGANGKLTDHARARPENNLTSPAKAIMRPPSQTKKSTARTATNSRAVRSPFSRPTTRQHERKASTGTTSSTASAGTTVLKSTKSGPGTRKTAAVTKKPAAATARGQAASLAVKRTTTAPTSVPRKATAPAAIDAAGAGRRTLRKRA